MAGIPEDDEMLPSCIEDVQASIDLNGDGDITKDEFVRNALKNDFISKLLKYENDLPWMIKILYIWVLKKTFYIYWYVKLTKLPADWFDWRIDIGKNTGVWPLIQSLVFPARLSKSLHLQTVRFMVVYLSTLSPSHFLQKKDARLNILKVWITWYNFGPCMAREGRASNKKKCQPQYLKQNWITSGKVTSHLLGWNMNIGNIHINICNINIFKLFCSISCGI